ncbi:MAG: hypothetical protein PUF50_07365, partial [Erysipelotrichaceae bacterium]|nr:hypothetical protein [Erysipelotrichaceae bacterium]
MARAETPKLSSTTYNDYLLSSPGWGGLNIADLEYDIEDNQSPDMINMMVDDGALGKRYGQSKVDIIGTLSKPIQAIGEYDGTLIVQAGNKMYSIIDGNVSLINEYIPGNKGRFFTFNRQLLFMNGTVYLAYDENGFHELDYYVPDIAINMKPDGSYADLIEEYNRLSCKFKNTFNGDGTSINYQLIVKNLQGNTDDPMVECIVGTEKWVFGASEKGFTVNWEDGVVTFTEAPAEGVDNVIITAAMSRDESLEYIESIMKCKYMYNYGGNNNSRLFVAGNGSSCYYYSDIFDASYFPESQYAAVGNGTD